ncbi:hypothetical protein [Saccharospirillum salsuginis]|uniref:Uncharacterized protein n=1 Tax=Saccharospirillum salsuginis TaxID=418750 RepID=A0A918KR56_9GAMM|nr:hypothetical protein [Saccharospirillum salsuginis]GGX71431.1 hypothetical protein GCM10007392_43690 [Saccharospirillum salsuginis]
MSREKVHWLLVYLVPYLTIGALSKGAGFLLLPLGGTAGVYVGFTSTAPYFTSDFKLSLVLFYLIAILLFWAGLKFRGKFWGKAINALGVYLWCAVGIVGFGPQ